MLLVYIYIYKETDRQTWLDDRIYIYIYIWVGAEKFLVLSMSKCSWLFYLTHFNPFAHIKENQIKKSHMVLPRTFRRPVCIIKQLKNEKIITPKKYSNLFISLPLPSSLNLSIYHCIYIYIYIYIYVCVCMCVCVCVCEVCVKIYGISLIQKPSWNSVFSL